MSMATCTTEKRKSVTKDIEYIRKHYFLDPKGSNADLLVQSINKTLGKLLSWYTQSKVRVDAEIDMTGPTPGISVKIRDYQPDANIRKDIIRQTGGIGISSAGHSLDETIDLLDDVVIRNSVRFNHRFLGQQHPHDNIPSLIGGFAGKFINANTIAKEVSPATTQIEQWVVQSLAHAFGYQPEHAYLFAGTDPEIEKVLAQVEQPVLASGNITVGGTTANLSALLVARNKAYAQGRAGASTNGLFREKPGIILGSEYAHYSMEKLTDFSGVGSVQFRKVKTANKKIVAAARGPDALKDQMWDAAKKGLPVIAVMATAGTTETGNIDDLEGIAYLLDDFQDAFGYRPHFHVDAAHGGGFVLHDRFNPKKEHGLLRGIERSDSITIDPHKMLYTHYSSGCVLFRDRNDHALLKQRAGYLFKENGERNMGEFRTEGSMGAEGALQTFLSLYALGTQGYGVLFDHVLGLTAYFDELVRAEPHFRVFNTPETNLLCFRYEHPALEEDVLDRINREAQKDLATTADAYISNDRLKHRVSGTDRHVDVFRACVMHPYTTKEDIDRAVRETKISIGKTIRGLEGDLQMAYSDLIPHIR